MQQRGWLYDKFHNAPGTGTASIWVGQRREKSLVPEIRDSQDTRDVSRVVSAHTGLVERGLGWQLLMDFRGGKRAKTQTPKLEEML